MAAWLIPALPFSARPCGKSRGDTLLLLRLGGTVEREDDCQTAASSPLPVKAFCLRPAPAQTPGLSGGRQGCAPWAGDRLIPFSACGDSRAGPWQDRSLQCCQASSRPCWEWLPVIRKPGGSGNPKRRPSQETPQATPRFLHTTSCHSRGARGRRPISSHPGLPGRASRIREHELGTRALAFNDREGTTQGHAGLSLPFEAGTKRGHNAGPASTQKRRGHTG